MIIQCCSCDLDFEIEKKKARKFLYQDEVFVCSKKCILAWIKKQKPTFPTNSGGFVRIGGSGIYNCDFKSDYEHRFALFLDKNDIRWEYETWGFKLKGGSYTPDFYLPKYGAFVEVKGRPGIGSRKKMLKFRIKYSDVALLIVTWLVKNEFYDNKIKIQ